MSTKSASNRYGGTRGSRSQNGEFVHHVNYAWAKDFNKYGLDQHYIRHGKEFKCNSKEEYAAQAVSFANHVDRKNYKSVIDWRGTTYKYDPRRNILVEVTKDGYVISYRHYGKGFWYEPKKGARKWIGK